PEIERRDVGSQALELRRKGLPDAESVAPHDGVPEEDRATPIAVGVLAEVRDRGAKREQIGVVEPPEVGGLVTKALQTLERGRHQRVDENQNRQRTDEPPRRALSPPTPDQRASLSVGLPSGCRHDGADLRDGVEVRDVVPAGVDMDGERVLEKRDQLEDAERI